MSNGKQKFEPGVWYSLADLARSGSLSMYAGDVRAIKRLVVRDREGKNVLKSVIFGEGTNARYRMKGENIIKFVALAEAGKI